VLTGAVGVVLVVHLEGVTVVQDALRVGGVVPDLQGLQGRVKCGLLRYDVDGRLSGPVGYRAVFSPFVRSCKYILQY